MAENKLYDVRHGEGHPSSDSPASQTMGNEPERPNQVDPPANYVPPPSGQQYPPEQPPAYQGYVPGYQPQPMNQPPPAPGYQPQPMNQHPPGPGYQQFHNPPQQVTSNTTTVVVGGQMQVPMPRPSNFLVFSILSAIFCCPIFGIIGIIYSAQVDSAYDRGDYWKASSHSSMARGWSIAALVCGLVIGIPLGIYFIVAVTVYASAETGY